MEQTTFYLLCVLMDYGDGGPTDSHTLYRNLDDALAAMEREIDECGENFHDFDRNDVEYLSEGLAEWHNEDGYGFSVYVDWVSPV